MDVLIANTAEAFLAPLEQSGDVARIAFENALSHRALYWQQDNKIVITPLPIPQPCLDYAASLFGWRAVWNWAALFEGPDLCTAICQNANGLFDRLTVALRGNTEHRLSAYALTPAYLALVEKLRDAGCQFSTLEATDPLASTLQCYLDSKSGFRDAMRGAELPSSTSLPEGYICFDWPAARERIAWFTRQSRPCVAKSNVGESGWGSLIIYPSSPAEAVERFDFALQTDAIWRFLPIVVEEYIDCGSHTTASPSIEMLVSDEGVTETYHCAQVISAGTNFRGVVIGPDIISMELRAKMHEAGYAIGTHYHGLGYRGYFDVDFVQRRDGKLFALETNMRRTGGTHAYDILRALELSGSFYCLTDDSVAVPEGIREPDAVFSAMGSLLLRARSPQTGVVPTFIAPSVGLVGVAVIGRELRCVLTLRSEIVNALGRYAEHRS